jgi:hypothetical protein
MVVNVVKTISTEVSDFYQAHWLVEVNEAPLIYPEAIAATRALGSLRRLWLKIDAMPQEYLEREEVMDRWSLPRSRDYGEIICYTAALDHFDQTTTAWWKYFKYDLHQKGQIFTRSWKELKRLVQQHFVPFDYMVEKVSQAMTTIVNSVDMKANVGKDVVGDTEPLKG